jgi:hypothetical protein
MCQDLYRSLEAYAVVLPSKRHKSVGKESGLTSYIERLNNTLRATNFAISQEDVIVF